jgi:hypothetical protein
MYSLSHQYKKSTDATPEEAKVSKPVKHYPKILMLWNDIREGHVNKFGIILAVLAVWSISMNYGVGL